MRCAMRRGQPPDEVCSGGAPSPNPQPNAQRRYWDPGQADSLIAVGTTNPALCLFEVEKGAVRSGQ